MSLLSVVSTLLLLAAVGLQTDYGDGSGRWLVYQALVYDEFGERLVPDSWPFGVAAMPLFLPLLGCWATMWWGAPKSNQSSRISRSRG